MPVSCSSLPAAWLLRLALLLPLASNVRAETYVLAIYETPAALAARTDPARAAGYWQEFARFGQELQAAGVLRGGSPFAVEDTQTVGRAVEAPPDTVRRPRLSGYLVIEAASAAEALKWAARAPNVGPGGFVQILPAAPSPAMP